MAEQSPLNLESKPKGPASSVGNRDLSLWVSPDLWTKHQARFEAGDLVEFRREGKLFQHWGLYLGENLVVHVSSFDLWQPFAGFGDKFVNASQASSKVSAASVGPVVAAVESVAIELEDMASDVKEFLTGEEDDDRRRQTSGECARCQDLVIEASPLELGFGLEERTKWFIKVENILRIAGSDQFRVNNVAQRTYKRAARTPKEIFQLVKCFQNKEVDYSLVSSNCEHFVTSLKYKTDANDLDVPDVVPVVMTPNCGTSSQVRRVVTGISMALVAAVGLAGAAVVSILTNKSDASKPDVPAAKRVKLTNPAISSL